MGNLGPTEIILILLVLFLLVMFPELVLVPLAWLR